VSPDQDLLKRKLLTPDNARQIRAQLRAQGRRVVQCHGCFDIVHPGHIRYLRFAKAQGDVLIVSVSADDVVGKGYDRPYINEELRLENLAAFEFVDHVYLDHNTSAVPVLELLEPDVYIKGREYETNADPRFLREKDLVEARGGQVIFSSGDVVYSSSHIIGKYRRQFGMEQERVAFFCRRHDIDGPSIARLLDGLGDKRVLVIGDPILDRYIGCEASSVANESPILSVHPAGEDSYLGGAGLIAAQIVALGGSASLLTFLGQDETALHFTEVVERQGVELLAVHADRRPVYVKTRYLVDDTKVFKVNEGRRAPLSSAEVPRLVSRLEAELPRFDAVVITDFGFGMFGTGCVRAIEAAIQRRGIPYYADVSISGHSNILKFGGARVTTPNEQELRFAFGDSESGLSNLAARYFQATGAERLVLTMSKRGVVVFHRPATGEDRLRTDHLPAFAHHAVDTVGAGDVLLAALCAADLADASPQEALYLGSCLAAVKVAQLGNDPVDLEQLRDLLADRSELR
jgi:rfaE bifunctional protein kinase chain/domain/rfaE bifunctional protein nucleotidyltransferase chain/domain